MGAPTSTLADAREQIKLYIQGQRRLNDHHYRYHGIVRSECTVLPPVQNMTLNANGVTARVHDWLEVTGLASLEPQFGAIGVHDTLNLDFLASDVATLLGPDVTARITMSVDASPTLAASLLEALAYLLD
ncbi:hypothetical protein BDZ89DRAFT_1051588 [Hymenopellis radicata]|nr:hypothetical protein BDZ89DRAFT_1051588 [Hymenopellis radicata]